MKRQAGELETEAGTIESAAILDQIGIRMLKRRVDALKALPTFPESILRLTPCCCATAPTYPWSKLPEL